MHRSYLNDNKKVRGPALNAIPLPLHTHIDIALTHAPPPATPSPVTLIFPSAHLRVSALHTSRLCSSQQTNHNFVNPPSSPPPYLPPLTLAPRSPTPPRMCMPCHAVVHRMHCTAHLTLSLKPNA